MTEEPVRWRYFTSGRKEWGDTGWTIYRCRADEPVPDLYVGEGWRVFEHTPHVFAVADRGPAEAAGWMEEPPEVEEVTRDRAQQILDGWVALRMIRPGTRLEPGPREDPPSAESVLPEKHPVPGWAQIAFGLVAVAVAGGLHLVLGVPLWALPVLGLVLLLAGTAALAAWRRD